MAYNFNGECVIYAKAFTGSAWTNEQHFVLSYCVAEDTFSYCVAKMVSICHVLYFRKNKNEVEDSSESL